LNAVAREKIGGRGGTATADDKENTGESQDLCHVSPSPPAAAIQREVAL
jgi:hypothetical protein